ncbi:MAG: hypothetical protein OXI96_04450 [Acidimicrobiaceae bacterium]|nr:hypothetical protein [Acidimicrobiaceae bacterium]
MTVSACAGTDSESPVVLTAVDASKLVVFSVTEITSQDTTETPWWVPDA